MAIEPSTTERAPGAAAAAGGDRWATFDCYGTLVDWNAGIGRELERLFGAERASALLRLYHELEPKLEEGGHRSYREVLTLALAGLAERGGVELPAGEEAALPDSLPDWPVFPEVPGALEEARWRGWKLAVLSNSDRDLISASLERIGVPFDAVVVAGEIGSYKPAPGHWERFYELTGASSDRHVHVAASLFHDIAPSAELGLTSIWINRLGERAVPRPTRELADLRALADTLDELVGGSDVPAAPVPAGSGEKARGSAGDGFDVRAPRADEAGAVADVLNAWGEALYGTREATEPEVRGWFEAPDLDRERDIRVAVLAEGTLGGYADVGSPDEGARFWIDLRVHPQPGATAIAERLLQAMEVRASERARPGAVLRGFVADRDETARRLFERRGYRPVRSNFEMEIAFDGPPEASELPPGITVRRFRPDEDERRVYEAWSEAFADLWEFHPQPYEEWLHWSRSGDFDPSLWFLAYDGDEVAGVCLCRPSRHGDTTRGWVGALAVRRPWRRRGLGVALLRLAFCEFHRRGLAGAGLGVDAENTTGAVALYERAGMTVARRHDTYEKAVA